MTTRQDLPLLPLVLICLMRPIISLPVTSQPPEFGPLDSVTLLGSPTEGFVMVPEDYEDLDYTATSSAPILPTDGAFERCDYNPCLENKLSCYELSISTGCLCPGFTPNNVPPEPPNLLSVTLNGTEVIADWCEPLSYVTEYVVTVGGQHKYLFSKVRRSGSVGSIDNVSQVCVHAVNDAGRSEPSCTMYQPPDTSLSLKVGLIVGVLVLLLLLIVGLIWRRRRQRKQEANVSRAH